ncbi:hypothetical protein P9Z86_27360, partial [Bacillus thuringiensis]|nr:hypothetical protein [Bacillus thuringiensis]
EMPVRFAVEFQKEHFVLLTIEILSFHLSLIIPPFIPLFAGSKTPTSKFSGSKEVRWGAGCPLKPDWLRLINQWVMNKTPLIKVSLY